MATNKNIDKYIFKDEQKKMHGARFLSAKVPWDAVC